MTKILVMDSAKKLNFFPSKQGISKYYSPRMILHQKNLDYSKNCKFAFGTFVQAHDEPNPSNTNSPRTLDCIYLRYIDSHQGGHELLHLPTNRVIVRRDITQLPITQAVLDQVAEIARSEGMPPGLKIESKTDLTLYDSTWIAGVDFQEHHQDDDGNEEEDDQDEMHPDQIAGLAQERLQEVNQDQQVEETNQDQNPMQTQPTLEDEEQESEIEIVFESDESQGTQIDDIEAPIFDQVIRT